MDTTWSLIKSFFQYNVSYLNDNQEYNPPNHKFVHFFGTVARAASKSTYKIKLSILVDDSGAGGFDYTLQVANKFDDIVISNIL